MNAVLRSVVLLSLLFGGGCSPDPGENNIGGKYYLSNIAGRAYVYERQGGHNVIVIGEQVLGYSSESTYVFLKRERLDNYDCIHSSGLQEIATINPGVTEYWILDLRKSRRLGPYDYQSYAEQSRRLVGNVVAIQDTYPNYFHDDISALEAMKSCQLI